MQSILIYDEDSKLKIKQFKTITECKKFAISLNSKFFPIEHNFKIYVGECYDIKLCKTSYIIDKYSKKFYRPELKDLIDRISYYEILDYDPDRTMDYNNGIRVYTLNDYPNTYINLQRLPNSYKR